MVRGFVVAFLLSFGPTVSNSFSRFAYALLLPAMREDLAWSYSQAGAINTVNALGYFLGALLVRVLVVRVGNRRLFCAGMLLTAFALAATGVVRDVPSLMLLRVLAGVGGAAIFVCGGALSGNIFPQRPELATTTIAIFFAGAGAGLMLTALTVPPWLDHVGAGGWPQVWWAMGAASLLMFVATTWAALRIEEPARAAGSARWQLRPLAFEFASYAMFALGYIGYMTFVIAWLRTAGGSTGLVVAVWFVLGAATLVAPVVWRKPANVWPGGWPLAAVMTVLATGSLLPLLSAHWAVMLLSAALFGLSMFSAPSSISSFIKHVLPKPAWGSAMATFTMMFAAAQTVGPWAIGWLADRTGSLSGGLAVSGGILALGALLAVFQRDPRVDAAASRAA